MPPEALILGFDSSAAHCAAALLSGDRLLAARAEEMGKGQAERLMPMLEEMLAEAGAGWGDLAAIGVGTGPGNFTGVRIAVAAARGLAMALGIPAVGVTSFEALRAGQNGPVLVALDARRGQIYAQYFDIAGGWGPVLAPPEALPPVQPRAGALCLGDAAGAVAPLVAGKVGLPRHPLAEGIARVAAARRSGTADRPAPLYLRPADAAPPREAAPVLLP